MDRLSVDRLSVDKLSVDKLSVDKVSRVYLTWAYPGLFLFLWSFRTENFSRTQDSNLECRSSRQGC